jgi:RNA polymerase sigma-70 factor, ECF subfamily
MDDDALVERVRKGDEDAFTELVTRYHALLVRVARYYVRTDASAEDVAQDAWIAVLRGVDRFEGRSSFKTWLLRIVANRARSTGDREHRVVSVDPSGTLDTDLAARFNRGGMWVDPPEPFTDAVENGIVTATTVRLVHDAIARLPDVPRTVVTLRDVEGLSTVDVATILQLSEANVRVILHRARQTVRSEIETTMRAGSR